MSVKVVHIGPVNIAALRRQAIGIDRRVHCPWVYFAQRIVFVDESHLILVMLERGRKKFLVHARAIGAFQIVEVDNRHLRCGIAPDRPSRDWNSVGRILRQVERILVDELCAVVRDQKIDDLGFGVSRDGNWQRLITRELARGPGANADRHIRRHLVLRANQNLNAPVEGRVGSRRRRALGSATRGQAQNKQSCQKTKA